MNGQISNLLLYHLLLHSTPVLKEETDTQTCKQKSVITILYVGQDVPVASSQASLAPLSCGHQTSVGFQQLPSSLIDT